MKFRDFFSLKHILFAVFVMAVMIPFAIAQGNNTVKVNVNEKQVLARSSRYQMLVDYEIIDSIELMPLADAGEKRSDDSYDDGIVRYGDWENDTWGAYSVCADVDVETCIVLHLNDGRTFVFNRKDPQETETIYQQLLAKLPA